MRGWITGGLILACSVFASMSWAHHPGHAVSVQSSGQFNPYVQGNGLPRKSLTYSFDWSHLDNGAGYVLLNQVEGEYAVLDRLSVLLRIPVLSLQMNFRPDKTGLGDISAGVKGVLWQDAGHSLLLGSDFSFPTGDQANGTGAGSVGMSSYLSYQYDFGFVRLFTSLGSGFLFDSDPEPTLLPSLGVTIPVLGVDGPLLAVLGVRAFVLLADETFQNGSAKVFAVPGLVFFPTDNRQLSLSLSGNIAIIDQLKVKPGIILSNVSLALVQDARAGINFQVSYAF